MLVRLWDAGKFGIPRTGRENHPRLCEIMEELIWLGLARMQEGGRWNITALGISSVEFLRAGAKAAGLEGPKDPSPGKVPGRRSRRPAPKETPP